MQLSVLNVCQHGHGNLFSLTAELNYKRPLTVYLYGHFVVIYFCKYHKKFFLNIPLVKIKCFTGYTVNVFVHIHVNTL